MKINCWVVWYRGTGDAWACSAPGAPGPCEIVRDGATVPVVFYRRKDALAEVATWKCGNRDRTYTVKPATLEVPE